MQSRYRTGGLELCSQAAFMSAKIIKRTCRHIRDLPFHYWPLSHRGVLAIANLEMTNRASIASGESSGDVGAYEFLEGAAHYAVDPSHPRNKWITDLGLAPAMPTAKWNFRQISPCSSRRTLTCETAASCSTG